MEAPRGDCDRVGMHEAETRALLRAVILLVLISAVRWGWSARGTPPPPPGGEEASVLPELLSASEDAVEEDARRSQALVEGERLDPNRADEVELDRLPGVGPSTADAIVRARDEGAVFRAPEDLLAVRGIGPGTLAHIRDFLDLPAPPSPSRRASGGLRTRPSTPSAPVRVDLNRADAAELQTLPGIGPAIAERILAAREKQLFTTLEDLIRVRGIGPATVERLRTRATVGP